MTEQPTSTVPIENWRPQPAGPDQGVAGILGSVEKIAVAIQTFPQNVSQELQLTKAAFETGCATGAAGALAVVMFFGFIALLFRRK